MFGYGRRLGSKNLLRSLEYGHLPVHGMGGYWLPRTVHQLDHLES